MNIDIKKLEKDLHCKIEYFDVIDSTSLYLKRLIANGEPLPTAVIAGEQTNGQGRLGKSFYSPASTGLYLTFAFSSSSIRCDNVTARAALAVARSLDDVFGCFAGIKWVNDIYLKDRKVAGILCQKITDYYLVGIGVNIEMPASIPEELSDRFGYIVKTTDDEKYAQFIHSLYFGLSSVFEEDKSSVLLEYRKRCIHIGRIVTIVENSRELTGICLGINSDFTIAVQIDGEIRSFSSGFMTLKL